MDWDWALFQLINGWAGRWVLLDEAVRLLANDYGLTTTMALGLVALWFEGRYRTRREQNQRAALTAISSLLVANVLLKLCNAIYFRPRPFYAHSVNLLFYHPTDSSLPSNAATVGFGIAVSVWLRNRRAGLGFIVAALLFAFARIFCGIHYPGDVLVGVLLGGGVSYLLTRQRRWLDPVFDLVLRLARAMFLA